MRISTCFKSVTILLTIMITATVIGLLTGCAKNPAPKPLPETQNLLPKVEGKTVGPHLVIGYYENPWPDAPAKTGSFPSMKAFHNSMTAVAPFWYSATKHGTLEAKDSQEVYDTARNLGLKIFPLIINKSGATDALLGDLPTRSKVIHNIVKLVEEKKYDGVNIDFQLVPAKHRDNLTAFMAELYPKLKAMNKTVIISVFPQIDVSQDIAGAYHYSELAKHSDFLQIMTYDHHWESSAPGPIAPIDWYEKNIKYAIEQCGGPHKVIIGIGGYGYDWPQGANADTITYADAIVRAEQHGAKVRYDENAQAPHFKYSGHEVWFENDESTAAKLDIIAKYNPAGIAIWRIGQEQPEIWPLIDKKFPKQK